MVLVIFGYTMYVRFIQNSNVPNSYRFREDTRYGNAYGFVVYIFYKVLKFFNAEFRYVPTRAN